MTRTKPLGRRKKTDKQKAKDAAWKAFSRFIRRRDCVLTTGDCEHGICCTCGKAYEYKRLQAGHYIAGRNNSILFDPRAVHAQCVGCNTFGGGQPARYEAYMLDHYGQEVTDDLRRQAGMSLKWTVADYREIAAKFNRWAAIIENNEVVPAELGEEFVEEIKARLA